MSKLKNLFFPVQVLFVILLIVYFIFIYDDGYRSQGDQVNGEYIYSYPDGTIKEKSYYKNGKLHGTRSMFFADGSPFLIEHYNNGLLQGVKIEYYTFGVIQSSCLFKNGERIKCEILRPKNEDELTSLEIELLIEQKYEQKN